MKRYTVSYKTIPTAGHDLRIMILQPVASRKPINETPAVLWIYGGGYMIGNLRLIYFSRAIALVKKYGAVVVAPEYRLSGEAPYPAALEDCYAALLYLRNHADEFGCNPHKLMVGGESAGGGLTAALCMYARDCGEVSIAFQMPLYPMMDDRISESGLSDYRAAAMARGCRIAWRKYLAGIQGEPPPYAAAARQNDYSNLPPAYSFVGSKEAFYGETMTYIGNLQRAGIQVRVDVYPTGCHAFDIAYPFWKISRIAIAEFEKQFQYAAVHYGNPCSAEDKELLVDD